LVTLISQCPQVMPVIAISVFDILSPYFELLF
jgi:hypothetical protein